MISQINDSTVAKHYLEIVIIKENQAIGSFLQVPAANYRCHNGAPSLIQTAVISVARDGNSRSDRLKIQSGRGREDYKALLLPLS